MLATTSTPKGQRSVQTPHSVNAEGSFWGTIIDAENIGKSSDDLAGYMTGQAVNVTGGQEMG